MQAEDYIEQLNLEPHPEGGYFKETYRSELLMDVGGRYKRNVSTAIYFMLRGAQKSQFHRIQSDELWFFHDGEALEIAVIINQQLIQYELGLDLASGQLPQVVIPANSWFAARIKSGMRFSLVSCTVAPGFDFNDFELAEGQKLLSLYPQLAEGIKVYL
jgi:predicted cupin superfamily sugar epimerase